MADPRKSIIDKIRKCLALAASDNEHEAALALERAHAMMAEHGVSADDVQLADLVELATKGTGALKPASWEVTLANAVNRALGTKVILHQGYGADWRPASRWNFVGIAPAPELACYAFDVLFRQLRKLRAAYLAGPLKRVKNPHRRRQRADRYCEGWATAVYSKVRNLRPAPEVAALLERWEAGKELQSMKPRETQTLRGGGHDDYWRGHHDGRDVALNRGVGGQQARRLGNG